MEQDRIPPHSPRGSSSRPRVVLDTDTYNEIDDQFALAYLLRSEDILAPEAIYAAPFHNRRSSSPGDGMEKSYQEIEALLERLGRPDFPHFRGAAQLLGDDRRPVESPAVADLVERATTATEHGGADPGRLLVVAIGAITNVASALLAQPSIVDRITVVWLGGNQIGWPHQREFNLHGDLRAAGVVFDSGVPLYVMPTVPVSSHLTTTREELSAHLDPEDRLCAFLAERFADYAPKNASVWSKEIWDVAAVAWAARPETVASLAVPTPVVSTAGEYVTDPRRHLSRFAYRIDRNAVYADLFARLRPT